MTLLIPAPHLAEPTIERDELGEAVGAAQALLTDLTTQFFERDAEALCLVVALIAREHVLLLGPPGTGKSAITNQFCHALNGRLFSRLLTKFSTDSEVFGPVSLRGLKEDRYVRVVDGYLPRADVAFLDEIFKANSAILNSLLTALNERAHDNGDKREEIPLQICIGASNELPQDDSLGALYDRFVLRRWVDGVKSATSKRALMLMVSEPSVTARLTAGQVETLREGRKFVDISGVADDMLMLFEAVNKEHGIVISDRRIRKCAKLVQSHAVLNGRSVATKADLRILIDSIWNDPSERPLIEETYVDVIGHDAASLAAQLVSAAVVAAAGVDMGAKGAAFTTAAAAANETIGLILEELDRLTGPEAEAARVRIIELERPIKYEFAKRIGLI